MHETLTEFIGHRNRSWHLDFVDQARQTYIELVRATY
jgi:hypothetical protein